jgi:hypothetical protein
LEERIRLSGGTGLLRKPIQMEALADLVDAHSRAEVVYIGQQSAA